MKNYGKGFEAYELISKNKNLIKDVFGYLGDDLVKEMTIRRKQYKRLSDFYYSLDDFNRSVFDHYIDDLIK